MGQQYAEPSDATNALVRLIENSFISVRLKSSYILFLIETTTKGPSRSLLCFKSLNQAD